MNTKKLLRKFRQSFMNVWPKGYIVTSKIVSRYFLFKNERDFLLGKKVRSEPSNSFVFYGANRAGSMVLGRALASLGEENGLRHIDLTRYFLHTEREQLKLLENEEWIDKHLLQNSYCYGPLRNSISGSALDKWPAVLLIRDPRDVVVSHYYSVTIGHTVFDKTFLEKKRIAKSMSLDEYALYFIEEVITQLRDFWELGKRDNHKVFRYEDLLKGGNAVLCQMAKILEVNEPSSSLKIKFDQEISLPSSNDASQHKRSGKHGQFIKKLKPATIHEIERRYGDELELWGYPLMEEMIKKKDT